MKSTYGICVSNEDPNNLGRIRAIPLSVLTRFVTQNEVLSYIKKTDDDALANKKYQPWGISGLNSGSVSQKKDPYVLEPFLPKHIGLLPRAGQLVKIINNDDDNINEFIGPYTIDQLNLTEEFRNVLLRLEYIGDTTEVIPKKTKTFISGFGNEQILLGEDEILLRLNHIAPNKTRKNQYPFQQITKFNNQFSTETVKKVVTSDIDFPINYICELDIEYSAKNNKNDKNFIGELYLYSVETLPTKNGKIGLTKSNYVPSVEYNQTKKFLVKHKITTKTSDDLRIRVENIISVYASQKKISYFDNTILKPIQIIDANGVVIETNNKFTNSVNAGGGVNDDIIIPSLNTWVFRLKPSVKIEKYHGTLKYPTLPPTDIEYIKVKDYNDLNNLINFFSEDKRFGSFLTQTKKQTISDVKESKIKPQENTAIINYADKHLWLSQVTPNVINDKSVDGVSVERFNEIFNNTNDFIKTYGVVRGEQMLKVILELINIILNHGHVDGVAKNGSVIENSQESLKGLKVKIENDLKNINTIGQNTFVINHNFRID